MVGALFPTEIRKQPEILFLECLPPPKTVEMPPSTQNIKNPKQWLVHYPADYNFLFLALVGKHTYFPLFPFH